MWDDYDYDEGSDIDNWEDEQVFQDHEGREDEEDECPDCEWTNGHHHPDCDG